MSSPPYLECVRNLPQFPQGTPEWLSKRVGMLTASDCAAALCIPYSGSVSGESCRARTLREKRDARRGVESGSKSSWSMDYGTRNEGHVRDIVSRVLGLEVHEVGLVTHPDHDWLGASVDGILSDGRLLEIKCPTSREIVMESVPEHYVPQMQVCMAVMRALAEKNGMEGPSSTVFAEWKEVEPAKAYPLGGTPSTLNCMEVHWDPQWFEEALPKLREFHEEANRDLADSIGASGICYPASPSVLPGGGRSGRRTGCPTGPVETPLQRNAPEPSPLAIDSAIPSERRSCGRAATPKDSRGAPESSLGEDVRAVLPEIRRVSPMESARAAAESLRPPSGRTFGPSDRRSDGLRRVPESDSKPPEPPADASRRASKRRSHPIAGVWVPLEWNISDSTDLPMPPPKRPHP